DFKRFLPEHNFLRKDHVCNKRRLLAAHAAARHRHDGKLVDKSAILCFEMAQFIQSKLLSPAIKQKIDEKKKRPKRNCSEEYLQIGHQLINLHKKRTKLKTKAK